MRPQTPGETPAAAATPQPEATARKDAMAKGTARRADCVGCRPFWWDLGRTAGSRWGMSVADCTGLMLVIDYGSVRGRTLAGAGRKRLLQRSRRMPAIRELRGRLWAFRELSLEFTAGEIQKFASTYVRSSSSSFLSGCPAGRLATQTVKLFKTCRDSSVFVRINSPIAHIRNRLLARLLSISTSRKAVS